MEKPSTELALEVTVAQTRDEQGRLTHTGGGTAKFATNDVRIIVGIIAVVTLAIVSVAWFR